MKFPKRIGYKVYFFIFSWLCLDGLVSLFTPEADVYTYYHTLTTLYPRASIMYILAITKSIINMICLVPLFSFAFKKDLHWGKFLRSLFFLRIAADLTGQNYEWQSIKSLSHAESLLPFLAVGIWVGISYLSYKAHYICAFEKTSTMPA